MRRWLPPVKSCKCSATSSTSSSRRRRCRRSTMRSRSRVERRCAGGKQRAASSGSSSGIELGGTAMQTRDLVLEVQDELGNNQVRCLALGSTDGLRRGDAVTNTGGPINVPVGEGTLGRIFNVLGQTIDSTSRSRPRRIGRSIGRRPISNRRIRRRNSSRPGSKSST